MLLVSDALTIAFHADGQLPLVISFKAVFLFVMSGAGFTLSNFYAETSDIAIREERTDNQNFRTDSLLGQSLAGVVCSPEAPSSIKRS